MKPNENIRTLVEAVIARHLLGSNKSCMDVAEHRQVLADSLADCLLQNFKVAEGETPGYSERDGCASCDYVHVMTEEEVRREDRPAHPRTDAVEMRRGLLADVEGVFAEARGMAGSLPPSEIDAERERVDAVRREVMKILRAVRAR